jgi:hypothetical protein
MQLANIETKIYEIKGLKVMLDYDLSQLYELETRVLNQSVKRNIKRFPDDFLFRLNRKEWDTLMSQNVISKTEKRGGTQKLPYAFTEQGVAMLSGILNSEKAINVNIAIMRAFVFIRQYAMTHKDLMVKLQELECKYDRQFKDVYEAITFLLRKDKQETEQQKRKRIGYKNT